jgi:hypothetical protein
LLAMAVSAFKRRNYSEAAHHASRSCCLKHSKQAQKILTHATNLARLQRRFRVLKKSDCCV